MEEKTRLLEVSALADRTKDRLKKELSRVLALRPQPNPAVSSTSTLTSTSPSSESVSLIKDEEGIYMGDLGTYVIPKKTPQACKWAQTVSKRHIQEGESESSGGEELCDIQDSENKRRRFDKYTSDRNNNSETDTDLNVSQPEVVEEVIIATEKQVQHCKGIQLYSGEQSIDFSRNPFFDNLVEDIVVNTELTDRIAQDCNNLNRLPVSDMVAGMIREVNDDFKAKVFTTGSADKSPSVPSQPVFFHKFGIAGDKVLNVNDKFHFQGAQDVPDQYCLLLKEATPSIPSIQSGSVTIPNSQCSRVEGSQAYTTRVCSFIDRGLDYDTRISDAALSYMAEMETMLEGSDAPPAFSQKLNEVKNCVLAQKQTFVELSQANASIASHAVYSQASLELCRRNKLLQRSKFRSQVSHSDKKELKSSQLCSSNIVDPATCSVVLGNVRSAVQGYAFHKQNNSSGVVQSKATEVARIVSTPSEASITSAESLSMPSLSPARTLTSLPSPQKDSGVGSQVLGREGVGAGIVR